MIACSSSQAFYSVDRKHFAVLDRRQIRHAQRRYSQSENQREAAFNDYEASSDDMRDSSEEEEAEEHGNGFDSDDDSFESDMSREAYMDKPIRNRYIHQSAGTSMVQRSHAQPGC